MNTGSDVSILYFPRKSATRILLLATKTLLGYLHEHIYLVSLDQKDFKDTVSGWNKEVIDNCTLKFEVSFGRYQQPPSIETRYIHFINEDEISSISKKGYLLFNNFSLSNFPIDKLPKMNLILHVSEEKDLLELKKKCIDLSYSIWNEDDI